MKRSLLYIIRRETILLHGNLSYKMTFLLFLREGNGLILKFIFFLILLVAGI